MGTLGFPAGSYAQDFEGEFVVQELAPGLSMLSGMGGNMALHQGADGTVLVDSEYPQLGEKLSAKLASLGAAPVRYVVNTHWHFDHVGANAELAKAGATIIAHDNVRAPDAVWRHGAGAIVRKPSRRMPCLISHLAKV